MTGSAALPGGAWKTLTVTLDTTADRLTTYLDGVAVGSVATTITASSLLTSDDPLGLHRPVLLPRPATSRARSTTSPSTTSRSPPEQVAGLVALAADGQRPRR